MAVSAFRDKIVASATGASDELFLEAKEEGQDYTLFFIASAWGSATLQISPDNVSWADYEIDVSGVGLSVVTKTKNSTVRAQVIVTIGLMSTRFRAANHYPICTIGN